jgi:hypothetical protein
MPYDSIILSQQEALFKMLGTNVKTTISSDGHTLVASDITETQLIQVQFITNNASNNAKIHFDEINVYLDKDHEPSTIHGFFDILKSRVAREDVLALTVNNTVYQPFLKNFQGGNTVNQLCDAISALDDSSPDTYHKVKTYTLIMGNACTGDCDPNYIKQYRLCNMKSMCDPDCKRQAGCQGY